jgi:hypothetical protein
MVQQPRFAEPRYSCTVSIESFTGNLDEEILTFGVSDEEAKRQAEEMLAQRGCSSDQIVDLMQQAQIEAIGQWCARE